MNMQNYKFVKEFMLKFGQEVPDKIEEPSLKIRKLRASLILEEALETIYAMGLLPQLVNGARNLDTYAEYTFIEDESCNIINVLDGLVDLDVVGQQGTAIAFGFPEELLIEAQQEVSRSNMSKLWTTNEVESYCAQQITEYNFITVGQSSDQDARIWLTRNKAGKVIKSPSYSPANLEPILKKYNYDSESAS